MSNDTIKIENFKNFYIKYKDEIKKYVDNCTKKSTDYSFVNLFCWQDSFKSVWLDYSGLLLIYYKIIGYIFMPCGRKFDVDEIIYISDSFNKIGLSGNFLLFNIEYVDKNRQQLEKHFQILEDKMNTNYIHLTERLVSLKGKKLNKKKNLVSQFKKKNPDYKVVEISKDNIIECDMLFNNWVESKDKDSSFSNEYRAFKKASEFFNELDLNGLMIKVNDKLVAFSIYSELNEETANIHFEKYLPEIKGTAQIINQETAKQLIDKYKYINREQDLGIPGLKKSKMSYDPDILLKYNRLIRK